VAEIDVLDYMGGGNLAIFDIISRYISVMVQDRLRMTIRWWHCKWPWV